MLVRILSNIASFLGNARHRAILISCLVLAFATSSVVGILAMHEGQAHNAATADETNSSRQQEDTIWLSESQVENKDTLEEDDQKSASKSPETTQSEETASETSDTQSQASISLSSSEITLAQDSTSSEITASVSGDDSESKWELTVTSQNQEIKIANFATTDKLFSFQLKSTKDLAPGEYAVVVDAVNGNDQKITAVIIVTVPPVENSTL